MRILKTQDVEFCDASIMDPAGKVFSHDGNIYRAIYSEERSNFYRELLRKRWINEIFESGLIATGICENIRFDGVTMILQHQKIPFEIHPAECTSYMHWLSAKAMIRVNLKLSEKGYLLKDGHPWNLMFLKGKPQFVDFGSIIKSDRISYEWFHEFKKYFAIPIWIAFMGSKRFALEYRRQHSVGFGLELFELPILRKMLFWKLNKIMRQAYKPYHFFLQLNKWLDKHQPKNQAKGYWADYLQAHDAENPLLPKTEKQKFVYDILSKEKPSKVLDCAANKGFYSEMAARIGASVAAFDYEEFCVDTCLQLAGDRNLDITPVFLNFKFPTPNYGIGLYGKGAFDRFKSDIVLILGLAHHLCIKQSLPVHVFCAICSKFAKKGIILEFVDPSDKHVQQWKCPIPADYSLSDFIKYFSSKFPYVKKSNKITDNGLCRTFLYLHK